MTYSTAKIVFSDSGAADGDVLTINNDINFVFGVDIVIGETLTITSQNTAAAINADADLSKIMNATVIEGGTGVLLTSTKLASLTENNFYDISISYDSETGATTPSSITTTRGYVLISAGSIVADSQNNQYALSERVLLNEDGYGDGVFVCTQTGEISCPANTLTSIVSTVDGWETVNNPSAGVVGSEIEGDESLYRRYSLSKTKYSMGYISSITGALYDIDGMKSVYVYENDTGLPKTHSSDQIIPEGETVEPHSIFVIVDGANATGDFDIQVAKAIMNKKSAGCGMSPANENLTPHATAHAITISPEIGGGTFTAIFNTPAIIPIYVYLSVSVGNYKGNNLQNDLKNILALWGNGSYNNEEGLTIGKSVSPFNISCVAQRSLGVYVKDCKIGTSSSNIGYGEIPIAITQKAFISEDNIIINI